MNIIFTSQQNHFLKNKTIHPAKLHFSEVAQLQVSMDIFQIFRKTNATVVFQ